LLAAGARPRRERLGGPEALTAAERRVVELALQDRTNREIAQALFLTRKTVETHLSSAYRKLDITSRRELREALLNG
jgi:DNA-binding CsgD family transcriptional regulator